MKNKLFKLFYNPYFAAFWPCSSCVIEVVQRGWINSINVVFITAICCLWIWISFLEKRERYMLMDNFIGFLNFLEKNGKISKEDHGDSFRVSICTLSDKSSQDS